jgi:cytochrome c-type biogenesis protein CcmH
MSAADAKEAAPLANDPVTERRLMTLSEELRCLVCQNETLASSRADLAEDLRREIREQIKGGASDEQIRDYLVARYGEFVLYRPRVKLNTLLLWTGPALFIILGVALLLRAVRRRRLSLVDDPDDGLLDDISADVTGKGGHA